MTPSSTIVIIDSDPTAAQELQTLLLNRPAPSTPINTPSTSAILISPSVAAASKTLEPAVDWPFIRIKQWDDYQLLTYGPPASVLAAPRVHTGRYAYTRVIFPSGRNEKRTEHRRLDLDAHLQPPFRATRLAKIWAKLSNHAFTPRPLDFFFLKHQARYITIRYPDLYQVHRLGRELWIENRHAEYHITSSLAAFQVRLPIPLSTLRRGWLVNEAYEPDPPSNPEGGKFRLILLPAQTNSGRKKRIKRVFSRL